MEGKSNQNWEKWVAISQENIIYPGWKVSSFLPNKLPPDNPSLVSYVRTKKSKGNVP